MLANLVYIVNTTRLDEGVIMTGVVLGNLAVDIRATLRSATSMVAFTADDDVTITAESVRANIGGTAWLFCRALISAGYRPPLLIGCVGEDISGRLLIEELRSFGIETDGIAIARAAPTSSVLMCYVPTGARLLIRPREQANDYLSADFVMSALNRSDRRNLRFMWVSGYALTVKSSNRLEAARAACNWARERDMPIYVDFVPHRFRDAVGDLSTVLRILGRIDGIVAELETLVQLEYTTQHEVEKDMIDACMKSARRLSGGTVSHCVVQHRVDDGMYLQVIGRGGSIVDSKEFPIVEGNLHGMGDVMSVDALASLGVLQR
jgi:sugar/nucleoside kinase (ribokinase family)